MMSMQGKYHVRVALQRGCKKLRCLGLANATAMLRPAYRLFLLLLIIADPKCMAAAEIMGREVKEVTGEENKEPQTEIAVIFLGPSPPRRYSPSASGGEYAMLLPEVDEVPPARLFYRGKCPMSGAESWRPLNVSFNNPVPMSPVPAERGLWLYRKNTGAEAYNRYVLIPSGCEGEQRVVFLTPSQKGRKRWNSSPLVSLISMNADDLKASSFILKNLSSMTVLHAFGEELSVLPPQKIISYQGIESGMIYRLAAGYGKQKKMIYDMAMRFDDRRGFHLYALYDADPKTNAGRKVGVFRTRVEFATKRANGN